MPNFKTLSARISNFFRGYLEENIFLLHIPKCGGSSVNNAIRSRYLSLDIRMDQRLVSLDPVASANVIRKTDQTDYPYDTRDDYPILKLREDMLLYFMSRKSTKYIAGHFTFSEIAYHEFSDQYTFITILRDPVKRWISAYFYNKYKGGDHVKIETDITTYLQSDFGRSQGYEYVKFLGGANKKGDYTSRQAIDRAQENLHKFHIVGCLEYQKDFLTKFKDRFGVRLELKRLKQNPKSKSFQKSIITAEIEEKIKTICKPDIEVYQYTVDRLVQMSD